MKLIIKEYLASLRERNELDAILPNLLSELGFNVMSRPSIGARQHGVNVAAVGPDENDGGKRKLFLFSIKPGDLSRQDWDGNPQALRPSLNEIRDVYIRNNILKIHKDLDIVICICVGGDVNENVRPQWTGYVAQNSNEKISFDEWNGDKLSELLLTGVLGEEILPSEQRTNFRKAVAMVDQPDVAYRFYMRLLKALLQQPEQKPKQKRTSLRQTYICLWVLYVWARGEGNLEAPYRASEAAMLHAWHSGKEFAGKKSKSAKETLGIIDQFIKLHMIISTDFIENKIHPFSEKLHALSTAVNSAKSVDVNLFLFETLGRIGAFGLWNYFYAESASGEQKEYFRARAHKALNTGVHAINNNPALLSPLRDDHAIEIMIFMLLAQACNAIHSVKGWIEELSSRCVFALTWRIYYPTPKIDYPDLIRHPRDQSDEYFREATRASILYPVLACWLTLLGSNEALSKLADCVSSELSHCNQQLWLPDDKTDEKIWIGEHYHDHGKALTHLPIQKDGKNLIDRINKATADNGEFRKISAVSSGLWPMFVSACRHYRMPLPPQFWTMLSRRTNGDQRNVPDKSSD